MAIPDLYINRNKAFPDIYKYDSLSQQLKIQIVHIWNHYFNSHSYKQLSDDYNVTFYEIDRIISYEIGVHSVIAREHYSNPKDGLFYYFEHSNNLDACLSLIELINRFCDIVDKGEISKYVEYEYTLTNVIDEINYRFKQNGVGYRFVGNVIIRVDNELLHQESIKPALHFLQASEYKNANEEFLKAHEHFRHNRYEACLVECNKSFESTMKIICSKNGWVTKNEFPQAKELVNVLLINDFLPKYHESQLNSLKNLLEGSIPTIRNKYASHGKGNDDTIKPTEHLTSYTLYMTGATIKFLIEIQMERESEQS